MSFMCKSDMPPRYFSVRAMAIAFTLILQPRAALADSPSADPATYLNDVRVELTKVWPEHRRIVVVCHGHSVPSGYFATPQVCIMDAYPHLLHVAITERYPTGLSSVICTGIGGEQSEQGAKRFDADVLAKNPHVVTIDYSLNDRRIGLERARAAWASMIERSLDAGVKVILLTPTPDTHEDLLKDKTLLAKHANQVRELAAQYGVGLVDSYAAFQKFVQAGGDIESLMSQPNHPNRKGHALVTRQLVEWFAAD